MSENRYEYQGHRKHSTISGMSSQHPWELASNHRTRILQMLPDRKERQGTILVVGIGDGSAVDLAELTRRFHEVHVIDQGEQKIRDAIQNQNLDRQRIFHRSVDISGIHEEIQAYRDAPSDVAFDQMIQKLGESQWPPLGEFDVVMSISQIPDLMLQAVECLNDEPAKLAAAILQIRNKHFEMLFRQVASNGMVLVVADIVSSKTVPPLAHSPDDLNQLVVSAVEQGNFFAGAKPTSIDLILEREKHRFKFAQGSTPWTWQRPGETIASLAWRVQFDDSIRRSENR